MKAIHHVRSDKVPLGIEIEKMNIVLDTNIIYRDWYLSGINFGLLEKFLKQSNAKLFVPEIVVLEAKNKFKQELIPIPKPTSQRKCSQKITQRCRKML